MNGNDRLSGLTAEDWFDVLFGNLVAAPFSFDIGVATFHAVAQLMPLKNALQINVFATLLGVPCWNVIQTV